MPVTSKPPLKTQSRPRQVASNDCRDTTSKDRRAADVNASSQGNSATRVPGQRVVRSKVPITAPNSESKKNTPPKSIVQSDDRSNLYNSAIKIPASPRAKTAITSQVSSNENIIPQDLPSPHRKPSASSLLEGTKGRIRRKLRPVAGEPPSRSSQGISTIRHPKPSSPSLAPIFSSPNRDISVGKTKHSNATSNQVSKEDSTKSAQESDSLNYLQKGLSALSSPPLVRQTQVNPPDVNNQSQLGDVSSCSDFADSSFRHGIDNPINLTELGLIDDRVTQEMGADLAKVPETPAGTLEGKNVQKRAILKPNMLPDDDERNANSSILPPELTAKAASYATPPPKDSRGKSKTSSKPPVSSVSNKQQQREQSITTTQGSLKRPSVTSRIYSDPSHEKKVHQETLEELEQMKQRAQELQTQLTDSQEFQSQITQEWTKKLQEKEQQMDSLNAAKLESDMLLEQTKNDMISAKAGNDAKLAAKGEEMRQLSVKLGTPARSAFLGGIHSERKEIECERLALQSSLSSLACLEKSLVHVQSLQASRT